MKSAGAALFGAAALLMIAALIYDPTVSTGSDSYGASESVYNLGALQLQQLIFLAGVGFLISGAVLYSAGELAERMERAGTAKSPTFVEQAPAKPVDHQCTFCDRNMAPYKPCSSATDEENVARAPRIKDQACVAQFERRGWLDAGASDRPA
jgi:hypothetical protein